MQNGRFYETDSNLIKLVNEDCLEFLGEINDGSVALVLIDPPYEISRDTHFTAGEKTGKDTDRFRVSMMFGDWDKITRLSDVIRECYRVLKDGGTMICFCDVWKTTTLRGYFDQAKFKQIRFIEWLKTNPVPINSKINYLTNAREVAIVGIKKSNPIFNSEYDNGVYRFPICHEKGRFHPTQKPLALIESLILKHSNEGDLICDCFSGSGTTAVAALNTKRSFVGCEISKEYFDKSISRLNQLGYKIS